MNETDRGRLAAATAGFAVASLLLLVVAAICLNDAFSWLGWQGGEYAYAFIGITLGTVLVGAVLKITAPAPWRSFGLGVLITGLVSVVAVLTLVLFAQAIGSLNP